LFLHKLVKTIIANKKALILKLKLLIFYIMYDIITLILVDSGGLLKWKLIKLDY